MSLLSWFKNRSKEKRRKNTAETEFQDAFNKRQTLDMIVFSQSSHIVSGPGPDDRKIYFDTLRIPFDVSGLAGAKVTEMDNSKILILPKGLGKELYKIIKHANDSSKKSQTVYSLVNAIYKAARVEGGARLVQIPKTRFAQHELATVVKPAYKKRMGIASYRTDVLCHKASLGNPNYAYWFITPHTKEEINARIKTAKDMIPAQQPTEITYKPLHPSGSVHEPKRTSSQP